MGEGVAVEEGRVYGLVVECFLVENGRSHRLFVELIGCFGTVWCMFLSGCLVVNGRSHRLVVGAGLIGLLGTAWCKFVMEKWAGRFCEYKGTVP